jgi:hypothetical protein
MKSLPKTSVQARDQQPETDRAVKQSSAVIRISRILWVSPLILGVPVFLAVGEWIPNRHGGDASIADGFRRIGVFCTAMVPVTGICWLIALVLTASVQVPTVKGWRTVLFWSCVGIMALVAGVVAVAI